jgi:hypothetical protein
MIYWSTVILTVDNDGYYNRQHRTYLSSTGSTVILTVDNDGYYNRQHRTYLWYTGQP